MSVIIGSARIDEHGHAHGGAAGDQKQVSTPDFRGEVSMQEFYNHKKGWIIARLKNPKQAVKCAKSMEDACNNKHIGYDQWQRYGVKANGTHSKINTEVDCSALVRQCIKEATGVDVGDIRTITMENTLGGFTNLFEPLKQYKPGMTLYTGDILFTGTLGHKVSGHTVIVVKGADRTGTIDTNDGTAKGKVAQPTLKRGSKGDEVKKLQKNLNVAAWKTPQEKLQLDGDFGPKTEERLKLFQKRYKLEVDGIYGPKSYAEMKKAIK